MLEYDRTDIPEGIDICIKQMHQKSVIFVIIGTFQINKFKHESYLWNGCHDLMKKAMNFNDVVIGFVKGSDVEFIFGL